MSKKYKSSAPFPNGSTYEYFNDAFCCRCTKYKLNKDGMPLPDNCEAENTLAAAQFDLEKWPGDDIVEVNGHYHVCLRFEGKDAAVMNRYRALFEPAEYETTIEGSGTE